MVGRGGLEPPTSALDKAERCAKEPSRPQFTWTARAELCGTAWPVGGGRWHGWRAAAQLPPIAPPTCAVLGLQRST